MLKANKIRTLAGTCFEARDFEAWNERMFRKYGNDRLYFHSNPIIRHIQSQRLAFIRKGLDLQPGDHFLDVGCGEGFLMLQLKGTCRRVGLDLSQTALHIARTRAKDVQWVKGNAEALPFPDETFDKVLCTEVIEHLINPPKVIAELCRVTKASGRVLITIPNEQAINTFKDRAFSTKLGRKLFPGIPPRTEWHVSEYTPELLSDQIRGSFEIETERVLPFSWCALGYGVLCRPIHTTRM